MPKLNLHKKPHNCTLVHYITVLLAHHVHAFPKQMREEEAFAWRVRARVEIMASARLVAFGRVEFIRPRI